MFGLVARVLFLPSAAGTVYWTVGDAVQKKAADIKTLQARAPELGEIKRSCSIADDCLKHNQSILAIIQRELDQVKRAIESAHIQLEEQKKRVETASEDREAAADALQSSASNVQEASADVKQAKKALDASRAAVSARTAEVRQANEALANATAHLETVITGSAPDEIPSAYADEENKQTALDAAQAELREAEKREAEDSRTASDAEELLQKREIQQQEAQKDFDHASATLRSAQGVLEKMRERSRPVQLKISELSESLDAQKSRVDALTKVSNDLHDAVRRLQDQHDADQRRVADDSRCIESLRMAEGQARHAAAAYNATRHAYAAAPNEYLLGPAWEAKDRLDKFRYQWHELQIKCAPQTCLDPLRPCAPRIPTLAKPLGCETDTGGTCRWLWCDPSRNAFCDHDTSSCQCLPGTCGISGQCQSRGPPPAATLEEPAVLERAEATSSGSLKIFVVIFAAMVGMTAAAAQKRSGSRDAILSERLLD